MNRQGSHPTERVVVLGTSAPNRFRTTSSVLTFFSKNNIIRKFELEQCSIHENGQIMIRFGTKFSAQLFCLKLQRSEQASRYFQITKLCCAELSRSQYIVLNLCVQRRSRDGNKFNNIIRRWRGEGIIDCNADRRQFYLYLFKDRNGSTDITNNDCYIKLAIDDRILDRISLINNDYSSGILFEVNEPPRCEIHKEPTIIKIDENINEETKLESDEINEKKAPICPKILLTGSCTNKSCTFTHNINSIDIGNNQLGNDEQFWLNERKCDYLNSNNNNRCRRRNNRNNRNNRNHRNNSEDSDDDDINNRIVNNGWKPAAYYSFPQCTNKKYNLDRRSDELENDNEYIPWTFEINNNNNNSDLLKFLGQCWLFCIEFVYEKELPERFVNAIRQMRGINPSNIETKFTDYEGKNLIPLLFNRKSSDSDQYYHPPFEYIASNRSSELRLKRHLHDLNYNGFHDISFALEACLHNFPPVFIPEDLVDNHQNNNANRDSKIIIRDPDVFFKCLFSEIQNNGGNSEEDFEVDIFSSSKKLNNIDLVWQALIYCSGNEEYRIDRSIITDDIECNNHDIRCHKQHILPALELFYKSLDYSTSNGRKLKQKKNGNTHADHVWIKRVSIHPLRLTFNICEEESTRMFRLKQYSPPADFCRIEFQDQFGNRSMQKEHFEIGNLGRFRAYKILQYGLNIAGCIYKFLFFGNKQVRDAKVWMKAELQRGYDANRVRADIARLSQERNIGKKMDRFHLFMSKGTPGEIYKDSEIEIINDIYAAGDDKILTDGCSLILEGELKKSFPKYVASMLVRIGGAKTQMMSASHELMEKLILQDIANKKICDRNLSPKIILTKSCVKFMTDTQKQLEIKKCSRALPCMLNREFINHCIFHRIVELQPSTINCVSNENFKLLPQNKQIILNLLISYQKKFISQLDVMENICFRQINILKDLKQRYGSRSIYIRQASQEEQRYFFDTLLFLASRLKVEESFLNRLTIQSTTQQKRLNFKDISDLTALLKRLWGGLKSKFKIQLDWPSCRMAGIADFQYKLSEFEIFLKIKIPNYFDWNCINPQCLKIGIKYWNKICDNCQSSHPIYYIHRGPIGLMKNPCLHPGSYRLFQAVYYEELDEMFDGEVLVFSAAHLKCQTSQVHKLSGGDLDGDDFLCITQSDLLPLCNTQSGIKCMEYDSDKPKIMNGYVNIKMCVKYWLNYQINDCVGIIAELHESFSDLELGVGSQQCRNLSIAHSKAVDYAKTGTPATVPPAIGNNINNIKYPHHMGKHPSISYKSNSIKGILYDNVRIPTKLWKDKEFRKQYNLKHIFHSQHHHGRHSRHSRHHPHHHHGHTPYYQINNPIQPTLTNREKLKERLNRGCQICGIPSFQNAHFMNQHKEDPIHKRNKQMARDKAMLKRIQSNTCAPSPPPTTQHHRYRPSTRRNLYREQKQQQQQNKYVLTEQQTSHSYSSHSHSHSRTILPSIQPINPALRNNNNNNYYNNNRDNSHSHSHSHSRTKNTNNTNIFLEEKSHNTQPNNIISNCIINVNQMNVHSPRGGGGGGDNKRKKIIDKKNNNNNNNIKTYKQWSVGDYVLYKNRDRCVIKDILFDSYPPRVLLFKMFQSITMITDFNKLSPSNDDNNNNNNNNNNSNNTLSSSSLLIHNNNTNNTCIDSINDNNNNNNNCYPYNDRNQQIKESKEAAMHLGFDKHIVDKEMKLFLDVVKVSGHSLNPSCFVNYLCEVNNNNDNNHHNHNHNHNNGNHDNDNDNNNNGGNRCFL